MKNFTGVVCPKCNTTKNSTVSETRLTFDGIIKRGRVCKSCGHRYVTYELRQDTFYRLTEAEKELDCE